MCILFANLEKVRIFAPVKQKGRVAQLTTDQPVTGLNPVAITKTSTFIVEVFCLLHYKIDP